MMVSYVCTERLFRKEFRPNGNAINPTIFTKGFLLFEDPSDMSQHGYNRATLAPINMYADHNYPDTLLPVLETGCYMKVVERKQCCRL
jgi:hypothetical protein